MKKRLVLTGIMMSFILGLASCGENTDATTTIDSSQIIEAVITPEIDETELQEANDAVTEDTQETKLQVAEATVLNLYVAASLKDAISEIIALYQEFWPNVTILVNADSSGTLQKQIEEAAGTDIDIFFSASKKQTDTLVEEGFVEKESIVELLKNQVVLISSKNSESTVTGFENIPNASNFALAADSVPVGQYSREIFETLGITKQVEEMEINECDNVSAVKTAVAEGSNEIGTVYYSDYYSVTNDVNLIAVADESWCSPIIYPVARVMNTNATDTQIEVTNDFISFLQSDEAKEIFEKYMFIWNQ